MTTPCARCGHHKAVHFFDGYGCYANRLEGVFYAPCGCMQYASPTKRPLWRLFRILCLAILLIWAFSHWSGLGKNLPEPTLKGLCSIGVCDNETNQVN